MLRDILLIMLSGAMLVLAFPPVDLWFLAWIGLVPFFFALEGKTRGKAFLSGLFLGIVFFLGTVYWVVNSMVAYGGVPVFTSIIILLFLVLCLSLYPAFFSLGMSFSFKAGLLSRLLFASSLWTALEYIRAVIPTAGFPWVLLGYSQSSFLHLIQIADITGVYGVSFLIVMANMLIFFAFSHRVKRAKMPLLKTGAFVMAIVIMVLGYGFFRISQMDKISAGWKTIKVGIVQGNIDQGRKWDESFQGETVEIYRNLSFSISREMPELIVWPETAVPFYLQSDKNLTSLIFDVPRKTGAHLFTGSPAYKGYGEDAEYYNSAFLISPDGEFAGRYDKIHLVPFGEYVPLKKYLPFIHKLVVGVGDFVPGKTLMPIEFNGNSFGALICFESIFPELAGGFTREGAGFLINITNDAWFGRTSAPYQHFHQAAFRAVENKVFLVRGANTGISGVFDPVGRIKLKSGIFTREGMIGAVGIKDVKLFTFYARYGDIFAVGCVIISMVGLGFWIGRLRGKSKFQPPTDSIGGKRQMKSKAQGLNLIFYFRGYYV